jgi:hypothetical protein
MFRAVRFFGHHVLRTDTRIGRKLGPKLAANGPPLASEKRDFGAVIFRTRTCSRGASDPRKKLFLLALKLVFGPLRVVVCSH